jgi:DNA-binding SARP family transcriptional activator
MAEVPPSLLRRERPPRVEGRLTLLDAFEFSWVGSAVALPTPAQRLVAYLAIEDRPLHRDYVAGALWLNSTDAHASGSLRSALWRIRRSGCELVEEVNHQLQLAKTVAVDVREAYAWAARVQDSARPIGAADVAEASASAELLRDWYDDWVMLERERFRQFRAHALEVLCGRLSIEGRFAEAIEVGLAAVRNEPLRESAHRAVISVHLAEGNRSEALRHYAYFRRLATDELGIEPSGRMEMLVRGAY